MKIYIAVNFHLSIAAAGLNVAPQLVYRVAPSVLLTRGLETNSIAKELVNDYH